MMDRDRFRSTARELRTFAEKMSSLAKMPDRVNADDVKLAAELTTKAAERIDELLHAELPGCICRRIDNDNYLSYAESCVHHASLFALERDLKRGYAKMAMVLKEEVRLKLIAAALSGTASSYSMSPPPGPPVVERAIAIADATIRQLTEAS